MIISDCVIAWLCYWVNILHAPMRFPAWIYAFRHLRYFNLAYFTKLTFIVWLCVIVWLCDCGIVWLCGCVTGRISSMHKRDSCFEYMLFCNLAKLAKLTIIYVIVWLRACVIVWLWCVHQCISQIQYINFDTWFVEIGPNLPKLHVFRYCS